MGNYYPPKGTRYPATSRTNRYPGSGDVNRYPGIGDINRYPVRLVPPGSPRLWYLASNLNGANNAGVADTDPIGTWTNLGSTGATGNAVQAVSGLRPIFDEVEGIIGGSVVDFSSGDYTLSGEITEIPQPTKIAIVYRQDTIAAAMNCIEGFDNARRQSIHTTNGSANINLTAGTLVSTGKSLTVGAWHMIVVSFNGASSYLRIDGDQSANINAGTNASAGMAIGALWDGVAPINGAFAEVLLYADGTSVSDTEIEAYFTAQWGATWPKI